MYVCELVRMCVGSCVPGCTNYLFSSLSDPLVGSVDESVRSLRVASSAIECRTIEMGHRLVIISIMVLIVTSVAVITATSAMAMMKTMPTKTAVRCGVARRAIKRRHKPRRKTSVARNQVSSRAHALTRHTHAHTHC